MDRIWITMSILTKSIIAVTTPFLSAHKFVPPKQVTKTPVYNFKNAISTSILKYWFDKDQKENIIKKLNRFYRNPLYGYK